jgi:hypothetical protein
MAGPAPAGADDLLVNVEPVVGLEPTTYRLQGDCSTN